MPNSGSETRQRTVTLSARLTPAEAELVRSQANRAGVSVAALIRHALFNQSPPRAARQPTVDRQQIAQLIGQLGLLKAALKDTAERGTSDHCNALIDAAFRDLADMRAALMEALGRLP